MVLRAGISNVLFFLFAVAMVPPASAEERHWNVSLGDFSVAANWSPVGVPTGSDMISIGQAVPSALASVDGVYAILDVVVSNGSQLFMPDPASRLVGGSISIEPGSTMVVAGDETTWDVDLVGGLDVQGSLFMQDAMLRVHCLTDSPSGGLLQGSGSIQIESPDDSGHWIGTIRPVGSLTLVANEHFDLDGSTLYGEATLIDATTPGCEFTAGVLDDPFSGTIQIGPGARVDLDEVDGSVFLNGGATQEAQFVAHEVRSGGLVRAEQGTSRVDMHASRPVIDVRPSATLFADMLNVFTSNINVDGTMRLCNAAILYAPGFQGSGTLIAEPSSSVRVVGNGAISMPSGVVALRDLEVTANHTLTIDAIKLTTGDPAVEGYDGHLEIGGAVTINTATPWRLGGQLDFESSGVLPRLHGSHVVVTGDGEIRTIGVGAQITAPITLDPGAVIDVSTGDSSLQLIGNVSLNGGTVDGPGHVDQRGDVWVGGHVFFHPDSYDWDGASTPSTTLVSNGADLDIDAAITDAHGGLVNVFGTLDVTNLDGLGQGVPWHSDGTVIVHGGSSIRGSGLTVDDTGVLDVRIGALIGESVMFAPLRVDDEGVVDVAYGAELTLRGLTTLDGNGGGAEITGAGSVIQIADLVVESYSKITCALYDWRGSSSGASTTTVLPGAGLIVDVENLSLFFAAVNQNITLMDGANLSVFTGDPYWRFAGAMTLECDSTVSGDELRTSGSITGTTTFTADVRNSGTVTATGEMTFSIFSNYVQTSSGTLGFELRGPAPGLEHGQIVAPLSPVSLAGTVAITLADGYEPAIGDVFVLVSAGVITGAFETIDAPGFTISYLDVGSDLVIATYVGLPCPYDANGDDVIDFGDILTIIVAWGPCGAVCPADVNDDGTVDFADILEVIVNWDGCS